jgi:hypothetical protein
MFAERVGDGVVERQRASFRLCCDYRVQVRWRFATARDRCTLAGAKHRALAAIRV